MDILEVRPERAVQQSPGWRNPRQRGPKPWVQGRPDSSPERATQNEPRMGLRRPFRASTPADSTQGSRRLRRLRPGLCCAALSALAPWCTTLSLLAPWCIALSALAPRCATFFPLGLWCVALLALGLCCGTFSALGLYCVTLLALGLWCATLSALAPGNWCAIVFIVKGAVIELLDWGSIQPTVNLSNSYRCGPMRPI